MSKIGFGVSLQVMDVKDLRHANWCIIYGGRCLKVWFVLSLHTCVHVQSVSFSDATHVVFLFLTIQYR